LRFIQFYVLEEATPEVSANLSSDNGRSAAAAAAAVVSRTVSLQGGGFVDSDQSVVW